MTLCPFKTKSFSKWMLSSCEEVWEGGQRSKSFTYCNKVEPLENFISSRPVFRICEKLEGLSVKPRGITVLRHFLIKILKHYWIDFLPKWRQKKYLQALSTGILKNALHKSLTGKDLFPVGMDVSSLWGLRKTGCEEIMLFIAWRSQTNLHPQPFFSHP